jgi:hypothetical protein
MDYHTGTPEIDSELEKRFAILAPAVQQVLSGDTVPTRVAALVTHFDLSEEARDQIIEEVGYILLYLEPQDALFENLVAEVLLAPDTANAISRDIAKTIFAPITHELGTFRELEEKEMLRSIPDPRALGSSLEGSAIPLPPMPPPATPTEASLVPEATYRTLERTIGDTSPQKTLERQTAEVVTTPYNIGAKRMSAVPVSRVMPHNASEAAQASTELPNALLKNLKATLMHGTTQQSAPPTPPETTATPSYGALLDTK